MLTWLIRTGTAPVLLDGRLPFRITSAPFPALLAPAVPMPRTRLPLKEHDHV